jgi:hypothetical protein
MEVGEAQAQQSGGSQPGGPKTQGVPSPLLMRKNKLHLAVSCGGQAQAPTMSHA